MEVEAPHAVQMDWSSCPPLPSMGLPGWTEAPVSTVAWAALDGVDYKMTALKHLEYQANRLEVFIGVSGP
jgi:hypothetical protein